MVIMTGFLAKQPRKSLKHVKIVAPQHITFEMVMSVKVIDQYQRRDRGSQNQTGLQGH